MPRRWAKMAPGRPNMASRRPKMPLRGAQGASRGLLKGPEETNIVDLQVVVEWRSHSRLFGL
eukprot:8457835-Pyramimonas_sp.AAC.1